MGASTQASIGAKRPDARALRSRVAMRAALLKLLASHPLTSVTGAMVSKAAGVGYSTFFRHYENVYALLEDTVGELAGDLAQTMLPSLLAGSPKAAALSLVEALQERRAEIEPLLAGAGEVLRLELSRRVVERLSDLPDLTPEWLPHRLALRVAVAATVELCEWWLLEEPTTPPAAVAEMLERLVVSPLSDR